MYYILSNKTSGKAFLQNYYYKQEEETFQKLIQTFKQMSSQNIFWLKLDLRKILLAITGNWRQVSTQTDQ